MVWLFAAAPVGVANDGGGPCGLLIGGGRFPLPLHPQAQAFHEDALALEEALPLLCMLWFC